VWVERLYQMVREHCSVEFQFKVITDNPDHYGEWAVPFSREIEMTDKVWTKGTKTMMMNRGKPQGAWAKCDIFRDGFADGPVINLDLDVVILDDIAPLVRDTLHMPWQGQKHNGSVYSFTPDERSMIYPHFIPYTQFPRGEQEYVAAAYDGTVGNLPDCYSYKIHIASKYGRQPPEGTRIVYFHGYPTPADDSIQNLEWVRRSWKGLKRIERE
jgi:hypothetical protein